MQAARGPPAGVRLAFGTARAGSGRRRDLVPPIHKNKERLNIVPWRGVLIESERIHGEKIADQGSVSRPARAQGMR